MKKKSPQKKQKKTDHDQILETACEQLRRAGLKRTPHREALLRFLIENHGPFSKEEIQKALPHEKFDSVTLYRNLAHFEELTLLRRSEFGDGVSRYEFQAHPDQHHHHIVCTQCHRIDSLDSCDLPDFNGIFQKFGYSQVKHALEFFGVCRTCSNNQHGSTQD